MSDTPEQLQSCIGVFCFKVLWRIAVHQVTLVPGTAVGDYDLNQLAMLYSACFAEEPWNENWSVQSAYEYLSRLLQKESLYSTIVRDSSCIIGFAAGLPSSSFANNQGEINDDQSSDFYIAEVAVSSAMRGRGIGTQIVRELFFHAKKYSYQSISLRTHPENVSMITICKKLDLLETAHCLVETGGKKNPRVILSKEI